MGGSPPSPLPVTPRSWMLRSTGARGERRGGPQKAAAPRTRVRDALQSGGDVDAIAHQVTVLLLDHVAEMDPDAEFEPALARRSTVPFCSAMAQRTASTTLRNSIRRPSPIRLTTRPRCAAMVGSTRSRRRARSRARVSSSSALVRRLKPTISAAWIAASFRLLVILPLAAH
jgi:hypothetical protein